MNQFLSILTVKILFVLSGSLRRVYDLFLAQNRWQYVQKMRLVRRNVLSNAPGPNQHNHIISKPWDIISMTSQQQWPTPPQQQLCKHCPARFFHIESERRRLIWITLASLLTLSSGVQLYHKYKKLPLTATLLPISKIITITFTALLPYCFIDSIHKPSQCQQR